MNIEYQSFGNWKLKILCCLILEQTEGISVKRISSNQDLKEFRNVFKQLVSGVDSISGFKGNSFIQVVTTMGKHRVEIVAGGCPEHQFAACAEFRQH